MRIPVNYYHEIKGENIFELLETALIYAYHFEWKLEFTNIGGTMYAVYNI